MSVATRRTLKIVTVNNDNEIHLNVIVFVFKRCFSCSPSVNVRDLGTVKRDCIWPELSLSNGLALGSNDLFFWLFDFYVKEKKKNDLGLGLFI